jgi:hypothetical protein
LSLIVEINTLKYRLEINFIFTKIRNNLEVKAMFLRRFELGKIKIEIY